MREEATVAQVQGQNPSPGAPEDFRSVIGEDGYIHRPPREVKSKPHSYYLQSASNESSSYRYDPSIGHLLHQNDTIYRRGEWDKAPIVIEEFRLLFFTIPKTGTTVFKQLFRRMLGYKNYLADNDVYPHHPQLNGLKYLYDYTPAKANEMMTSKDWTRAIFVRDPVRRALSAFLDKGLGNDGLYVKRHCCGMVPEYELNAAPPDEQVQNGVSRMTQMQQGLSMGMRVGSGNVNSNQGNTRQQKMKLLQDAQLGKNSFFAKNFGSKRIRELTLPPGKAMKEDLKVPSLCKDVLHAGVPVTEKSFPFQVFVDEFMPACDDPHWRPQNDRIDKKFWPYINYVGSFDALESDTRKLLEKIGAWDKYGSNGWNGNGSIFSRNEAHHKTSAGDKISRYYTAELEETVRRFYGADYDNPVLKLKR